LTGVKQKGRALLFSAIGKDVFPETGDKSGAKRNIGGGKGGRKGVRTTQLANAAFYRPCKIGMVNPMWLPGFWAAT
jgi:hypothetical protein